MATAKDLLQLLPIISENVLAEAAKQPQLFMEVARYRVGKMRERSRITADVEYWAARVARDTRTATKDRGGRITEGQIKERVKVDRRIRRLEAKLRVAEAQEEFSKLLLEAFRMRRDSLRIIAEGQIIEGRRGSSEVERIEARHRLVSAARRLEDARRGAEE